MHKDFLRQIMHCLPRLFHRTVETPSIESFVPCEPLNSPSFILFFYSSYQLVRRMWRTSALTHQMNTCSPLSRRWRRFCQLVSRDEIIFLSGVKTKCYIYSFNHLKVLIIYFFHVQ